MKFLILVSSLLALASASWEPIHEKYHGPLHYPKIHKGVPVEPVAVQHAREVHLMALSQAFNINGYSHHDHHDKRHEHYEHDGKWEGPKHYPVIKNGVPVEPKEVQNAREAHLTALSYASHNDQSQDYDHQHEENQYGYEYHGNNEEGHKWNGPLHFPEIYKGVPVEPVEVQKARAAHLKALYAIHNHGEDHSYSNQHNVHGELNHYETPKIGHDGKPLDTNEVEAANSKHFSAVHDALARNSHGISHHYRKRRGAESYVHFSSIVEHKVPVKYYQHDNSHYENHDHESKYNGQNAGEYSYEQIHAPVYGHYEDKHDNSHGNHQTHAPIGNYHQSSHGFSYEQIHAPVCDHQDSHHRHQIPVIGREGTPVDTLEVQHARAVHLAAHAAAKSKHF